MNKKILFSLLLLTVVGNICAGRRKDRKERQAQWVLALQERTHTTSVGGTSKVTGLTGETYLKKMYGPNDNAERHQLELKQSRRWSKNDRDK